MSHLPENYCIVGGGPAGLVTARAFKRYGIETEIIERHTRPGGIWNKDQPGSPLYSSCNFISSRDFGGFIGYPMPADYPMYPRWDQIRDYVQAFARDFGLADHARFGVSVTRAWPVGTGRDRFWKVQTSDGEIRSYRGVVVASGGQWDPVLPDIPGLSSFTGTIMHSSAYEGPHQFAGREVLVVGAGNSGVDIVADAAFHGRTAYLSTRRGYWYLPKYLFGLPVPDLMAGNIPPQTSGPLAGKTPEEIEQMIVDSVGDLTTYGLPRPDHQLGTTHTIVNGQVIHCLAHGMLSHRPDVAEVRERSVVFCDGREETVDTIVLATGYRVSLPWLADELVSYSHGHPDTHLGTFSPTQAGLYFAGAIHFGGSTFPTFDRVAQLAAADAHAQLIGENAENMAAIRNDYRPDLTGGFPFLSVERNANQVHLPALEQAFTTISEKYQVPIPAVRDADFYQAVQSPESLGLRHSVDREPAAASR